MRWKEYEPKLIKAREIYNVIFSKPSTHEEWARSFNKIAKIAKLL